MRRASHLTIEDDHCYRLPPFYLYLCCPAPLSYAGPRAHLSSSSLPLPWFILPIAPALHCFPLAYSRCHHHTRPLLHQNLTRSATAHFMFALCILLFLVLLEQQWPEVPRTRHFASIGPSLWNCLPPSLRYSILCLSLRLYLVLSLTFFLELKNTESASVWLMSWERYINVYIQYSAIQCSFLHLKKLNLSPRVALFGAKSKNLTYCSASFQW